MWRSLVAHLHGVQGVEGSNPFTPTIGTKNGLQPLRCNPFFCFQSSPGLAGRLGGAALHRVVRSCPLQIEILGKKCLQRMCSLRRQLLFL